MYAMQPTIIIAAGHSMALHDTALEMVAMLRLSPMFLVLNGHIGFTPGHSFETQVLPGQVGLPAGMPSCFLLQSRSLLITSFEFRRKPGFAFLQGFEIVLSS